MDGFATDTLAYAAPNLRIQRFWGVRIALACGLVPLIVGVLTLLLYLISRFKVFGTLGLFTLLLGVPINLVGIACVIFGLIRLRKQRPPDRVMRKRFWLAACILLLNYPTAYACLHFGWQAASRHTFLIRNTAAATCDSFVIVADGVPHEIGPISAGSARRFDYIPQRDGNVTFSSRLGATAYSGELIGYVDHGPMGSDHRFSIQADGSVTGS